MGDRLIRFGASLLAGLLMCVSFPPIGWWWAAVPAIAVLAWVLTRHNTTLPGGFGYGFVFGLAFYLPLIPWISGLVGPVPWILLGVLEALFTAVFGMFAVLVARLPGWPLWLALVWCLQEMIKSSVPFGGFPWGVTAFSQANGPFLNLAVLGGAPLVSFAVVLLGTSLCALVTDIVHRIRHVDHDQHHVILVAAALICAVLLGAALTAPTVRRNAVAVGDEPTITVAAAAVRRVAGELLGHRPAHECRRRRADHDRRAGDRSPHPGRHRAGQTGLHGGQPARVEHRSGVGPGDGSG